MIKGVHAMFYSSQADALRKFLRDKLGLPFTDVGDGWLIFDLPEGDVGAHPTDFDGSPPSGTHNVSFYCDDIESTVATLQKRGVEVAPVIDRGYGFVTQLTMPGGVEIELYQPKYGKGASRPKKGAAKKGAAKKGAAKKGAAKKSASKTASAKRANTPAKTSAKPAKNARAKKR
jgi:predicted enzyme related to lactoylglutathione lyase